MSIRYVNRYTGEIAKVSDDHSFIAFKEKYGTRMQTFSIRHRDQIPFYLDHRGYTREKTWECICASCYKVIMGRPCLTKGEKNPSGECVLYPKASYPKLDHAGVRFKLTRS